MNCRKTIYLGELAYAVSKTLARSACFIDTVYLYSNDIWHAMIQPVDRTGIESAGEHPPRLLHQVREAIRILHYSRRTEESYVHWIRRFIFWTGKRHPATMGRQCGSVSDFDVALRKSYTDPDYPLKNSVIMYFMVDPKIPFPGTFRTRA